MLSEAGDVCWYVAELCNELGFSFSLVVNLVPGVSLHPQVSHSLLVLSRDAGRVADLCKKVLRDSEDARMSPEVLGAIHTGLVLVLTHVAAVLHVWNGKTLHEAMAANLDKLEARRDRGTLHGDGDAR